MILKSTRDRGRTAMPRVLWAHFVAGAIGSGLLAVPAFAQPAKPAAASGGIEEVVVTARRVQENLQRVPVAVTAVSAEALEQKSITKVEELAHTVPGFTAQASFQSGQPIYTIRGQHGDTNPTPNTEPAVQVYFAEMNTARAIGTTGAFFDLDSIQVLKGPQGTLFGRNSTGGAILISPRAPENTFGGYVRGSYGNFDYRDFEAALNVPLGDKVALRVGGKIVKRDGYIKNLQDPAHRGGELDQQSGRISLLLKPNDAIKSTFIATYYANDTDGNTLKFKSADPHFAQQQFLPPVFSSTLASSFVAYLQNEAAYQQSLDPYTVSTPAYAYDHDRVQSIQNNTEIQLNDKLTLKNIVGYRYTYQDQQQEFAGGTRDGEYLTDRTLSHSKLFSEELQLQGKLDKLDFVVGGYFLREEVDLNAYTRVLGTILPFASVPDPVFAVIPNFVPAFLAFPARDQVHNPYSTSSYSGFAHGTYDLSSLIDGLSLSGGARMTYDIKKVTIHHFDVGGTPLAVSGYTCVLTGTTFAFADEGNCAIPGRVTSTELTYDVSLNYQMTPETLVYAAHRHGYRAGGFDVIPPLIEFLSYKPEFVDDVEVGLKTDFEIGGMPVRLNGAGYYQIYKDIQRLVGRASSTGSVANVTINVAKANIYGGELEMTIKPTPAIDVTATYAYTKADNKVWNDNYTSNITGITTTLDISDSGFAYVSPHQWSVTGRYALPIPAQLGELSLSAIWYGQSAQPAADVTTGNCGPDGFYLYCYNKPTKVPAYNLVNLRADWQNVAGKGFDLGIFATNVANTVYRNTVLGLNGTIGVVSEAYGPPRMYGVTLKVPFGGEAE